MIDLHTHILPGMDDGARDVETSLAMLRLQQEQQVQGVALTPHFYREDERPEQFFARRERAWERLQQGLERDGDTLPELVLGAEVAWVPGLNRWEELERFCLGSSRYLLLELPDSPWRSSMIDQLYDLMDSSGIIPVLAHLDRSFRTQRADHLREVLNMGVPVQISAQSMLGFLQRRGVIQRIRGNRDCVLISDCHNLTDRRPNLGMGLARAQKSLPSEQIAAMRRLSQTIFGQATGKETVYADYAEK